MFKKILSKTQTVLNQKAIFNLKNTRTILLFNSLFFVLIAKFVSDPQILKIIPLFYFIYALEFLILIINLFFNSATKYSLTEKLGKFLKTFLPAEIILIFGLLSAPINFNVLFHLAGGLYLILTGIWLIRIRHFHWTEKEKSSQSPASLAKSYLRSQGKVILTLLLLVMAINFLFGIDHLAKFAAVDEPLWTFERVPQFFRNILDGDWDKTNISDKPGITVALISGWGIFWENPRVYKKYYKDGEVDSNPYDIADLNLAMRLPIFLFAIFSLPIFYFFLERLLGKTAAIYSTILIGLSPILLGISRIINPDSLLWIFAPLSLIAFLTYYRKRIPFFLYASGFFLGLALLTKYVANILLIFFLGWIFLEYIFNSKKYQNISLSQYLKQSLTDYLVLIFVALATFYLPFPAAWVEPKLILNDTIFSQAFQKTWPVFLAFFLFLLIDTLVLKSKILKTILDFLKKYQKIIFAGTILFFLLCLILTFINVYLGMSWFDFVEIISSPKTSYSAAGYRDLFLANFFPFVFTLTPITILALIIWLFLQFRIFHKKTINPKISLTFALIVFILLYYLATTVNQVAATNRYQIILFPLAMILAGLALGTAHLYLKNKFTKINPNIYYFSIILISTISLWSTKPLFMSYDSILLPNQYYTNLKDMGDGSYEAAEFINSLPNADQLHVWTDKRGVCSFLKAKCFSGFDYDIFWQEGIDLAVISAGRQSRTTKLIHTYLNSTKKAIVRFDWLYDKSDQDVIFDLPINQRPANFIKVIKINDLEDYRNIPDPAKIKP